tara:strand:- start:592 stop:864 length:273 start_codon:yes stop_codon:yes gene_type:complete
MKNTILMISVLVLGACAPQNLARLSSDPQEKISTGNFEYIGCHKISAGDDKLAMGLLGLGVKTTTFSRVYFKQRKSDGSSSELKLTPCWR